ncbi:MAG: cobalamin-dependent protein [Deltaproteobacteria bacterium]|nr:cobalamin-dependent protein [Deltaproteobacteria bacterium]MBW1818707.1 cobalamin-dependent protein [Deltaproteobacteria bacterium]
MNIVLVFPPFYLASMYNLPPLGLLNLATSLKGRPHRVVILDFVLAIRRKKLGMGPGIYDDCAGAILDEDPHVVGFSGQCTTYPAVIQIARRIKEKRPQVKVVIGGHNGGFVDAATIEAYPFVDCIVRSEGEATFPDLVAAYGAGRDENGIQGTTYRSPEGIVRNEDRPLIEDLDDLPFPDYGFLPPLSVYRDACGLPRSIAILEVGRGCPHRCSYCSESVFWRRRTRTFSVSRLVKEMENLHRNFGAECFLLAYDQFTAKRSFVESFCGQVIEKGLNRLPWYCISRLDSVDRDLLALMREAGCESMCYGIDSGSKRTLDFIHKNIEETILYQRVAETAENGMIPTLSYVIGFPEEERADIDQTLWLALRTGILGNNNPLIQLPTVLPGTELHARYANSLVRELDTYFALGLEFDRGIRIKSDDEMIDAYPDIFSSFYNLPCRGLSIKELNLIATYFPLMVRLYPKTFLLLSLESGMSATELFLTWLKWLAGLLNRMELTLSPQECYRHFADFTSHITGQKQGVTRKHFFDVLKYETTGLEAGKFSGRQSAFTIDLLDLKAFRPLKNAQIIIESFDFDMQVIIMDLISGRFTETYPPEKKLFLFRQEDDVLDVSEINAFVRDFLEQCNGNNSLNAISDALFETHGEGKTPKAFFDACVEALQILGEQGFFHIDESDHPPERR